MNIFVIPSWYRSKQEPLGGIFFKEQILALARARVDWKFVISWHGYEDYSLPLNNPIRSMGNLIRFYRANPHISKLAPNVWEFFYPALVWNDKFRDGNIRAIIGAHQENFIYAEQNLGKFDLIHALASIPAGYIAKNLASKRTPYILSEHIWPFSFYFNEIQLNRAKKALKSASWVAAVSKVVEDDLKQLKINSTVIPNMIDENFFKPGKKRNPVFTFFTLGTISPEKGFDELLMAIKEVVKENIRFRIGGDGKNLKKYQKLARKYGIDNKIDWLGRLSRKQVLEEYQNADAFIMPSHQESFGMVYAEALACGLPVIATKCGGPEDIVNSRNGLLVPVKDCKRLSRAIIEMSKNPKRFSPQKIRADFLTKFSTQVVTKKIIKICEETKNAA